MAISWSDLEKRHEELNAKLVTELGQQERQALQKEHAHLADVLGAYHRVQKLEQDLAEVNTQLAAADADMKDLFQDEQSQITEELKKAQQALDDILYPPDNRDTASVFIEIRAGAGGQEAALFAADLARMYLMYSQFQGWQAAIIDSSSTDLGGVRDVTLHIEGKGVYAHLKHEAGVHRVQRVPKTETQGRVHTSTATVAVLPEVDEVDVSINPQDLRVDTYRAGGAGGQHVNKTDSAIRITHIPSGLVVACQEERSQHKNRAKAMKMLQSRLAEAERERKAAEESKQRKEMVGTGMRAEKVRTYNYPQNRVTDHQVDITLKKLDMVMVGHLDEIIQPLMVHAREERKKQAMALI